MMEGFKNLGISKVLEDVLNKNGIKTPTPIQERSIGEIMNGKDVVAQAQTGTGKTLAFLLPIVEKIRLEKMQIQALILTPTRELAIQITDEAKKLKDAKDMKILAVYGGQDVEAQMKKLKNGVHLVIATPGRLLDHVRRGTIDMGKLETLVLDEADEMLRMGFLDDVEKIIMGTPKARQTMLFSATIPNEVRSLSKKFMRNPVQIQIEEKNVTLDEIEQVIIETSDRRKLDHLCGLINEYRPYLAIVFCRTKRRVKTLNEELSHRGYNSDELHGDLSQAKREKIIKSFRKAELQILVATDIVARGIDIEGVTHVINYDIPDSVDGYIHRIGRTGRIGNLGMAITFVTERDKEEFTLIQRKLKADFREKEMKKEKLQPRLKDSQSREEKEARKDGKEEGRRGKPRGEKEGRASKEKDGKFKKDKDTPYKKERDGKFKKEKTSTPRYASKDKKKGGRDNKR